MRCCYEGRVDSAPENEIAPTKQGKNWVTLISLHEFKTVLPVDISRNEMEHELSCCIP